MDNIRVMFERASSYFLRAVPKIFVRVSKNVFLMRKKPEPLRS